MADFHKDIAKHCSSLPKPEEESILTNIYLATGGN